MNFPIPEVEFKVKTDFVIFVEASHRDDFCSCVALFSNGVTKTSVPLLVMQFIPPKFAGVVSTQLGRRLEGMLGAIDGVLLGKILGQLLGFKNEGK